MSTGVWIALIALAIFVIVGIVVSTFEEHAKQRQILREEQEKEDAKRARAFAKQDQEISNREKALADREDKLQKQRSAFEGEQIEQEERLDRARASVVNAVAMMTKFTRDTGAKVLASRLRESYLFDSGLGEWISVIRVINPDLNGNVEFHWKLSQDMPRSTCVTVYRDGEVVKNDWGIEGQLKQHLPAGHYVKFSFSVTDDRRQYGEPLVVEVNVPDVRFWAVQYSASKSTDYSERYRETIDRRLRLAELREEAINKVKARKDISEELREWMLGVIESETAAFQSEV